MAQPVKVIDPNYVDPLRHFMNEQFVSSSLNDEAIELIGKVHESFNAKPRCGLIYAPTDYGKTASVLFYIRQYMLAFQGFSNYRDMRPIIHLSLPSACSKGQFYSLLLQELGDIKPEKGFIQSKKSRVKALCEGLSVTLIIIDDFNRLLKAPGRPTNTKIAQEIQLLCDNDLKIPFLLVGLDTCRPIFDELSEIFRRTPLKYDIRKFGCSTNKQAGQFIFFLESLEKNIPGGSHSISSIDMAKRIYLVSNGVPGRIKTLIETARAFSTDKCTPLSIEDYFTAFEKIYRLETRSNKVDSYKKIETKHGEEYYIPALNPFTKRVSLKKIGLLISWTGCDDS